MAKTLLRSGDLDDFQAVGGGGQAVFDSALQIREALRLRKQQAMVDCLAIPQVNDDGDRVDWYSPLDGRAVSWKAADEDERFRALRYLESTLDSAASLSRKSLQSGKTAQQLFGSLLEKALQFPGINHVFLVDGKPVITFWGFVNLNENARDDVLACLRDDLAPEPEIVMVEEPEEETPPAVTFDKADEPLVASVPVMKTEDHLDAVYEKPMPSAPVAEPEEPVSEPAPAAAPVRKKRPSALWALPVAAVVVAAIATPVLWKQQETVVQPKVTAAAPAAEPTVAQSIVIPPQPPAPRLMAQLPLHQAEVVAAKTPVVEAPKVQPATLSAIPKDALVMDALAVKTGSTRFLNGSWRVMLDIKDEVTGKPPTLRFQIQNNKGTARLTHGDNITCRAEIYSGLHQTGELMIKSRSNARCSDGSRYPMPEITCTAGSNDVAQCTARYDAKTVVPVTFRKTGA